MLCKNSFAYDKPAYLIAPVEQAIQKFDWNKLSKLCNDKITITIDNNTKIYSKRQGISVLNEYITKKEAGTFKIIYFGKRNNRVFAIGTITKNNKKHTVLLLFERSSFNHKYLLNEINFE